MSSFENYSKDGIAINSSVVNQSQNVFHTNPVAIIKERTHNDIIFNVMPNKMVEEHLYLKEYRIWDNAVEAVFDRTYQTQMEKSPNHLTFVTTLIHMQKMLYVYMCHKYNIKYDPEENERLKIWPTILDIDMPKMVTKQKDISHKMYIKDIRQTKKENTYLVTADTEVENRIFINGQALVIIG